MLGAANAAPIKLMGAPLPVCKHPLPLPPYEKQIAMADSDGVGG